MNTTLVSWNDLVSEFKKITKEKNSYMVNYYFSKYLEESVSSSNEKNFDVSYWLNKIQKSQNTNSFFYDSYILLRNKSINANNTDSIIKEIEKNIKNEHFLDFSNVSFDLAFVKELQKITKGLFRNGFTFKPYKYLNVNQLIDNNISFDTLCDILMELDINTRIDAKNIYSIYSKLVNEQDQDLLMRINNFSVFSRNIENNILDLFNLYLQDTNTLNKDEIFAEILNQGFNYELGTYYSNELSQVYFNKQERVKSLNKIFKIKIRLKAPSPYFKEEEKKLKKDFEQIHSYVLNLNEAEQKSFLTKFPSLIPLIKYTNFNIISDIADNYYDNFEHQYLKENTLNFGEPPTEIEKRSKSRSFFFSSINSRVTQEYLDLFSDDSVVKLLNHDHLPTDLKIKKSKYLTAFIQENIYKNKYISIKLLSQYMTERKNLKKAFKLFNINKNFKPHKTLFINLYEQEQNFSFYKIDKYTKILDVLGPQIHSYIQDAQEPLDDLKKYLLTDYLGANAFFYSFPIDYIEKTLDLNEHTFDVEFEQKYSILLLDKFNDPVFTRYYEILSLLLESNIIFQLNSSLSKSSFSPLIKGSMKVNLESLYNNFHLLDKFCEKTLELISTPTFHFTDKTITLPEKLHKHIMFSKIDSPFYLFNKHYESLGNNDKQFSVLKIINEHSNTDNVSERVTNISHCYQQYIRSFKLDLELRLLDNEKQIHIRKKI